MPYRNLPRVLTIIILVAILHAVVAARARANVGPQWWGGYASEPNGGLEDIAIVHETLDLDLRPLAKGQAVGVEATYELHNFSGNKNLHLVFVAGTDEVSDFVVCLNERPLASQGVPTQLAETFWASRPAAFDPALPLSTGNHPPLPQFNLSAMQSAIHIGSGWYPMALVPFAVELPPGRSTLRASYHTKAVETDEEYPTATWHLPYVLSPARAWRSFGGLDVTAHVPDGWDHLTTLPLERTGNELHGSFAELPADVLVVSTRLPVGPEHEQRITWFTGLYFLIVMIGGVFCMVWGRWVGQWLSRSTIHCVIRAVLILSIGMPGLVWGALVIVAWRVVSWGVRGPIALQESPYYHEHFFLPALASFFFSFLAVPLGIALTGLTAFVYRRYGKPPSAV